MSGWLMLVVGAVIALPQVVRETPWMAAFAVGLLLMVVGGISLTDQESR